MTKKQALDKLATLSDMPCVAFDVVRELSSTYEAQLKKRDTEIERLKTKDASNIIAEKVNPAEKLDYNN